MGSTHAAAYTHRNNNVLSTTTLTFDQRGACGTSTGHAVWVTHRNSTTVNVVDFWVDTQLVATVKHLLSKSSLTVWTWLLPVVRTTFLPNKIATSKWRAKP